MNIKTLDMAANHLINSGVVDFNTMTVEGKQLLDVCGLSASNTRAEIARQIRRHNFHEAADYTRITHVEASGQKSKAYHFKINAASMIYANSANKAVIANRDRKEIRFGELLSSAFPDVEIVKQHTAGRYRIDFYMPEHNLAIEYDEYFHKSQKYADRDREEYIGMLIHCDFIRVPEGEDGAAIIEIYKRINGL